MVHIGVVAGWQAENIGDVAHIPGTLTALQRRHPEARISLLVHRIGERELRMLARYFPTVDLITDPLGDDTPITETLQRFLDEADVLVHGSGPCLVAIEQLRQWRQRTAKPYGFFGITVDPLKPYHSTLDRSATMIDTVGGDMLTEPERELFPHADFLHCRDSLTVNFLQGQQLSVDRLRFGPDATVLCDFFDDEHGTPILDEYGLVEGEFMCAVPRLRFTPYHQLRGYDPRAEDRRKDAYNAGYTDSDLEVLRHGITTWVRRTGHQALIVPEMSYAVDVALERLQGTFPDDIADRVHVLPRFWELQEAAAVYRRSAGVLSMECHTPLVAIAEGVPAVYLRQPTDTIKGMMYRDLGLGDHVVELDDDDAIAQIEAQVERIVADPVAARARMVAAKELAVPLLDGMADDVVAAVNDSAAVTGGMR